jgi:hypothetical protein
LAGQRRLYTAALQRFWLEGIGDWLVVGPTRSLAREIDVFDEHVLSPLVGLPERVRAAKWLSEVEEGRATEEVVRGVGVAGDTLSWVAVRLQGFETHLVLKGGGGALGRGLRWLGDWLLAVEGLLERPRYLWLLLMATLVVIL